MSDDRSGYKRLDFSKFKFSSDNKPNEEKKECYVFGIDLSHDIDYLDRSYQSTLEDICT